MKISIKFLEKIYDLLTKDEKNDKIKWHCDWELTKYKTKEDYLLNNSYETIPVCGNMLLTVGANAIWGLVTGTSGYTPFSYANTYIGVGSSSIEAKANQTGLQGGSKAFAKVEEGFPKISDNEITYQATFNENEANFSWNEMTIINGPVNTGTSLNRKVYDLGTKDGGVWTLRAVISLN